MSSVGVRELKHSTSRILRRVRETGQEVAITFRGEVIARLVPAERKRPRGGQITAWCKDLDRLAAEIGAHWPKGASAAAAVREGRRG